MDKSNLVKESLKCPLSGFSSSILSPRGMFNAASLIEKGFISKDDYPVYVQWCDLCGLCASLYDDVKKFWRPIFEKQELKINVVSEGMRYILFPEELYNFEPLASMVNNIVNVLSNLGYDFGLVIFSGFLMNFIDGRLNGFSGIRRSLIKVLLDNGVDDVIVLDRYTNMLVGRHFKVNMDTMSSLVSDVISRGDLYPIRMGSIKVNLLNSAYKFYRREIASLARIIKIVPQLSVSLSSEKYGFGFAPLYGTYDSILHSYLRIQMPASAYILSTVDPIVYLSLWISLRKYYAISYLPLLILNILERF